MLNQIQSVRQTFANSHDYKAYLLQCSDHIEACHLPRGSALIYNGDKCSNVFIILSGSVGIYELKTPQEFQKQRDEAREIMARLCNNKIRNSTLSSLGSMIHLKSQQNLNTQHVRNASHSRDGPSIEDLSDQEAADKVPSMTKTTPVNKNLQSKLLNARRKIKMKAVMTFMGLGSGGKIESRESVERAETQQDCLTEDEQLLLENEHCKKKYFKEGACMLTMKERVGPDDIINEKCLVQAYRSPVTMIAEHDVQCLKLSREVFRDILKGEIEELEYKKEFIFSFFKGLNQAALLKIMPCVIKKKYKMHEKIYNEGERSRGVFFVKTGGEVKLTLNTIQKPVKDDLDTERAAIDASKGELFLPNQLKGIKKKVVTVAIVSKGDFFGEEDIVLGQNTRRYTAMSMSNELELYHIPAKNYHYITETCSHLFKTLQMRAKQRNIWIEDKLKTQAKDLYQSSKPKDQNLNANNNTKQILPKLPSDQKNLNKVLVINTEEYQQLEEGHVLSHFIIAREKEHHSPPEKTPLHLHSPRASNISLKPFTATGSPSKIQSTKSSEKSPRKASPDNQQSPQRVKPLDFSSLSPCYKLFRQEKKSHTYMNNPQSLSTNRKRNSERTTMTGLTKDQVYFHSIQNLALSHIPSSSSQINLLASPTMASMAQLESPQTTRIRPQFSVKSFTHMEVQNLAESATSLIYSLKDCSPMLTPMGPDGGSFSPIKDSRGATATGTGKIRKGTSQMKRKLNRNFTDSPGSNTDKASLAITLTPLLSPWGGQSVRGGEFGIGGGFTERAEGVETPKSGSQTSRAGKRVHIKSKTVYQRSGFFSAEQTPKIGGSLLFEGGGNEGGFGLGEKVMRGTQMKTVIRSKENEKKMRIMRSSLILEKNQ